MTRERLRLAAVGDVIPMGRLSRRPEDALAEAAERLRAADVAVGNLETTVHRYEGAPASGRSIHLCSPPETVEELSWLGLDAVSVANNHAGDFGREGMRATLRELSERGLAHSGLGETAALAYAPAYVETPAGRVGLVSATTTYEPGDPAGPAGGELPGRPGVAALPLHSQYRVTEAQADQLEAVSEALGLEAVKRERVEAGFPDPDGEDLFSFMLLGGGMVRFRVGEEPGFRRRVDPAARERVLDAVSDARRQADWVVCSLHCHEGGDGRIGDPVAPDVLESLARRCVDAGADAVVGHGPHVLRGIEVRDGAPIFYSLGDFVVREELTPRLAQSVYDRHDLGEGATPADVFDAIEHQYLLTRAFWETVLPVCTFEDGAVSSIALHPVDLGYDRPRARRGVPGPVGPEAAERILETVAERSGEYGTDVRVEDGRGVVDPA